MPKDTLQRRELLKEILVAFMAINAVLYLIGLVINVRREGGPFFDGVLLLGCVIGHLPLIYEVRRISQQKSLSVFGSYLPMVVLWALLMICILFVVVFPPLLFLVGMTVVTLGVFAVEAGGLPLLFFCQIGFWLVFAPKIVLLEMQTQEKASGLRWYIHPTLRQSKLKMLGFLLAAAIYVMFSVMLFLAFTSGLVPPDSEVWDSWMFN